MKLKTYIILLLVWLVVLGFFMYVGSVETVAARRGELVSHFPLWFHSVLLGIVAAGAIGLFAGLAAIKGNKEE